jgi:hypothetical protein
LPLAVIVEGSLGATVEGFAEQLMVGGSNCLIVNCAEQVAVLFFFSFVSVAVPETV